VPSMGRTECAGQRDGESFFSALKNELVYRTVFPTRTRTASYCEYIEVFYNRQRLHSGLDYKTPEETYQATWNPARSVEITLNDCPENAGQTKPIST